jgi:hypothetical protein
MHWRGKEKGKIGDKAVIWAVGVAGSSVSLGTVSGYGKTALHDWLECKGGEEESKDAPGFLSHSQNW